MSASQYSPATLASLLKNLSISSDEPDHEALLKHAEGTLKGDPTNPLALHTKAVALLYLDRYEEAVELLEKNNVPGTELEKAYALYKVGRSEDVKAVVSSLGDAESRTGRGLKHVEAQAVRMQYRMENFDKARAIYNSLHGNFQVENEENDLDVNVGATEAQLCLSGATDKILKTKATRKDLEAFETSYNTSILLFGRGEYKQSLFLLKKAEELCRQLEGYSEEELRAELDPILAQQVYVHLKLGDIEQAKKISESIDINSLDDPSIKLVAANNELLSSSVQNPYLSIERLAEISKTLSLKATNRLFHAQDKAYQLNNAILDIQIGKYNSAKTRLEQFKKLFGDNPKAEVIKAVADAENAVDKALLEKLLARDLTVGSTLIIAQLYLQAGNITGAIEVLEKAIEKTKKYYPGMVALLVALYKSQGRKKHTGELLAKAGELSLSSENQSISILRAAGIAKLASEEPSENEAAGKIFQSLLDYDQNDPIARAGLIAAYATLDPSKIQQYLKNLSPVASLISGINAEQLENAGVALPPSKKVTIKAKAPAVRVRKTRKRRRLPKDYDPEKKVDPERWMPMKDRSYYKPKGKKAKKAFQAMQGGRVAEELDISRSGSPAPEKKAATVVTSSNKPKKKKGKGGKW